MRNINENKTEICDIGMLRNKTVFQHKSTA